MHPAVVELYRIVDVFRIFFLVTFTVKDSSQKFPLDHPMTLGNIIPPLPLHQTINDASLIDILKYLIGGKS
jgi:hypothetical protein